MEKIFKVWCVNDKNEIKTVELPMDEDELKGLTLCTDWTVGPDKLNEATNLAYLTQFGVGAEPLFDYDAVTDQAFESMGINKGMTLEDLNDIAVCLCSVDDDNLDDLMVLLGNIEYGKDNLTFVCCMVEYGNYRIIRDISEGELGKQLVEEYLETVDEEAEETARKFLCYYTYENYVHYAKDYILQANNTSPGKHAKSYSVAEYNEEDRLFVEAEYPL